MEYDDGKRCWSNELRADQRKTGGTSGSCRWLRESKMDARVPETENRKTEGGQSNPSTNQGIPVNIPPQQNIGADLIVRHTNGAGANLVNPLMGVISN